MPLIDAQSDNRPVAAGQANPALAEHAHSHPPRQVFVLRLKAEPGCDHPIHSLRRLLKYALRQCGLRAISATEEKLP
jgi:hypothetical protein